MDDMAAGADIHRPRGAEAAPAAVRLVMRGSPLEMDGARRRLLTLNP